MVQQDISARKKANIRGTFAELPGEAQIYAEEMPAAAAMHKTDNTRL